MHNRTFTTPDEAANFLRDMIKEVSEGDEATSWVVNAAAKAAARHAEETGHCDDIEIAGFLRVVMDRWNESAASRYAISDAAEQLVVLLNKEECATA